jgi:mono/diheme cytochrome c family protein
VKRSTTIGLALVILLLAGAIGAFVILVNRGYSARTEPGRFEEFVALQLRTLATPREVRRRENPVPDTEEYFREAMRHFAEQCAVCHGNDGRANTTYGRNMYPRVPDMRLERTQGLTDGELFYIIENGVRFTGMPAFGIDQDEGHETWKLVHFIRRLPTLSDEIILEMEEMSPRTPEEFRREEEIRRFLEAVH